jgi:uncharacterized membrane protein YraQ (UPF0718 family)
MIAWIFAALLWLVAGGLFWLAARRRDGTGREALRRAWTEFLWLLPRLAIGILAAGFLAKLLPEDQVAAHLGPDSGALGLLVATIAGALTPGGPVVGFSIGTAALKSGAALPQVVAYVTAWGLVSFNRVLVWELPIMPREFVWLRILVSLPLPMIAGAMVMAARG